jgi:hypothetical protein
MNTCLELSINTSIQPLCGHADQPACGGGICFPGLPTSCPPPEPLLTTSFWSTSGNGALARHLTQGPLEDAVAGGDTGFQAVVVGDGSFWLEELLVGRCRRRGRLLSPPQHDTAGNALNVTSLPCLIDDVTRPNHSEAPPGPTPHHSTKMDVMKVKKICCIGAGYVGGPTMAVRASLP